MIRIISISSIAMPKTAPKKRALATTKKTTTKKRAAPPRAKKIPASRSGNVALGSGDRAPAFSLASTEGKNVSLKDLAGTTVVLYFYPKDMTSGCTVEAREFSALAKKFTGKGVRIYGVSPDSISLHEKFIAKEGITFPLLADLDHRVAEAYGVWKEKSMYGNTYMGIERTTFVIGPDGRIIHTYAKVKPEGHAVCVLDDLGRKK